MIYYFVWWNSPDEKINIKKFTEIKEVVVESRKLIYKEKNWYIIVYHNRHADPVILEKNIVKKENESIFSSTLFTIFVISIMSAVIFCAIIFAILVSSGYISN